MDRGNTTEDQYQKILSMAPEDRVRQSGNLVNDKIVGVLVAFSRRFDMRDGWIDIITTSDAEKEIRQLIVECGGKL